MITGKNIYSASKAPILFLVLSVWLIWHSQNSNYLLILDQMVGLLLALLCLSLFWNTSRARISPVKWVYIGLICAVLFISIQSAENYVISSTKLKLDVSILLFGSFIYVSFSDQLVRYSREVLTILVLVFLINLLSATLFELLNLIKQHSIGSNMTRNEIIWSFDLSFYSHLRHFSYHSFICSTIAWALFKTETISDFRKTVFFIFFALCFITMLLAFGRGSVLAFFAFIVISGFLTNGLKASLVSLFFSVIGVLSVYLLLYLTPYGVASDLFFGSFNNEANNEQVLAKLNNASNGRTSLWVFSIKEAFESPIYGHGSASAHWLYSQTQFRWASQPHNFIVQLIMDFGFFGAAIISYFIAVLMIPHLRNTIRDEDKRVLHSYILAIIISYFLFSMVDGLFYHPFPMVHFVILAALLAALFYDNAGKTTVQFQSAPK